MRFRFSSRHICIGAAALALSGLLVCSAQAADKGRGRSIEFSQPRSDEATTNLYQLTNKKDGLKQLEEDLYKPQQSFAPQGSLDGVVARPTRPPAGPVIQNKRVKELLERRKNWVFMSPEDLIAAPTAEEILKAPQYGPDGQEKKDLPAMDRYYQRLTIKRPGPDSLIRSKNDDLFGPPAKSDPRGEAAAHEDSNLPSGLRESAQELNTLVEPGGSGSPFAQSTTHGSLADVFGLATKPPSKEQVQEHKKFMDGYRSLVDPSWRPPATATPGNLLAIFADAPSPAGRPAMGLPNVPSSAPHRGLEAQSDVINPMLGPAGLPDVNARALGQTRPTSALPKVEQTRAAPVAPTFTAPIRSFR